MRLTVNCSILLKDLPLPERFRAVRSAGFAAVELWWPFTSPAPDHGEVSAFVGALRDAGVQLTGLNFDAGDMAAGDRGLVSLPDATARFRANVDAVTTIGELTGCRAFNALYGLRLPQVDPLEQDRLALENLAFAADGVARIGGTVLVEPVSGAAAYPLRTAADAVAIIDSVAAHHGQARLGLLLDVYHLASNGDDVAAAIRTCRSRIAHVQVADAPGRGAPGTGGLPITRWLDDLHGGGYDGWVGLEYLSTGPDPFGWCASLSTTAPDSPEGSQS